MKRLPALWRGIWSIIYAKGEKSRPDYEKNEQSNEKAAGCNGEGSQDPGGGDGDGRAGVQHHLSYKRIKSLNLSVNIWNMQQEQGREGARVCSLIFQLFWNVNLLWCFSEHSSIAQFSKVHTNTKVHTIWFVSIIFLKVNLNVEAPYCPKRRQTVLCQFYFWQP